MSDADKKKRNQRREDISVYITMGGIKYFKKDYSKKVLKTSKLQDLFEFVGSGPKGLNSAMEYSKRPYNILF